MAEHRIGRRLALGFGTIMAALMLSSTLIIASMDTAQRSAAQVASLRAPAALTSLKLNGAAVGTANALRGFMLTRDPTMRAQWGARWAEIAQLTTTMDALAPRFTDLQNRAAWAQIKTILPRLRQTQSDLMDGVGKADASTSSKALAADVLPLFNRLQEQLVGNDGRGGMANRQADLLTADVSQAVKRAQLANLVLLVTVGVLFAVSAVVAWLMASGIEVPLRRLSATLRSMADGDFDVEVPGVQLKDEVGDIARVALIFRQNGKALRERTREAQAANEAKSEFLANMSHEIRTPLTAILGFTGLLRQTQGLPREAERHIQRIATAGDALLTLVNDVLDFSKLEAGQLELDPHPFDLAEFLRETIELVAAQIAMKRLTIDLDLAEELPETIVADSARLRQILLNLLGNAIKFTPRGGVRLEARYDLGEGLDGRLRVAVIDTGDGIPAERLDRLFLRFSQVDGSVSREHGGSGLGLAICKRLAELMGGEIGVESLEGAGSIFWFTIAAKPGPEGAMPRTEELLAIDMVPSRLLVVDDVAANRELLRTVLSPFGHEITEASSGREAVELAHRRPFDLILMDVQMPGMDGLAATRTIRSSAELNHATPILAFSADVLAGQLATCMAAGMNDHIAKPIDLHSLISKIARWSSDRPLPLAQNWNAAGSA